MRVIEYTVHTTPQGGTEESCEVFALVTDLIDIEAYPALDLPDALGMRDRDRAPQDRHGPGHGGAAQPRPRGGRPRDWALFAVYQAIHTLIGAAVDATGIPPDKISFPHALAAATDTVSAAFPPSRS